MRFLRFFLAVFSLFLVHVKLPRTRERISHLAGFLKEQEETAAIDTSVILTIAGKSWSLNACGTHHLGMPEPFTFIPGACHSCDTPCRPF